MLVVDEDGIMALCKGIDDPEVAEYVTGFMKLLLPKVKDYLVMASQTPGVSENDTLETLAHKMLGTAKQIMLSEAPEGWAESCEQVLLISFGIIETWFIISNRLLGIDMKAFAELWDKDLKEKMIDHNNALLNGQLMTDDYVALKINTKKGGERHESHN